MKKLFFILFKRKVFNRFSSIKTKQNMRLNAVIEARNELNKWSDIPYSWQKGSIGKTLHYPKNTYPSNEMLRALTLRRAYTDTYLASLIPLSWFNTK